ncbi:high affinity cGMP-specific 3',5'-cyclic phosphodiesterase 9A isoform X2 [Lepeophtheirus salmonis]|uniref:high affinity cGMP-specific 3',5'-cyclic phosphodiesterase 9A isoform X2 n=1 Tax=Lepeophtheirus salmonis TaxID=72036 RepID=UPI001AE55024|nr:high affinity cGMP-specific 3',5'-cyclic phosphodiesterase 9A-like isoform X2 [Lepeophtheirus salmonis]
MFSNLLSIMGTGISKRQGHLYLLHDRKVIKVMYDRYSSLRDMNDQIATCVGLTRFTNIVLKSKDGTLIAMSPSMLNNTQSNPYKVHISGYNSNSSDIIAVTVKEVGKQFHKVFMVEDMKKEVIQKMNALERRVDKEGRRLVEMEKYKLDLVELRDSIYNRSRNTLDYNRLRPCVTMPEYYYSPTSEKETISSHSQSLPQYNKYKLSEETKEALKTPGFNMWQWEPNEVKSYIQILFWLKKQKQKNIILCITYFQMLILLEEMYYELGIVDELEINPIILKKFLIRVQEGYRNNPFHNFRHSFSVTQMMYVLIHTCKLNEHLSIKDLSVLITACICHDLDHPGFNNTYQINARTDLSIRYNDMSPLENHHCAMCFKILSIAECNIFANCGTEVSKEIRGDMIILILATDMARHAEILDAFKQKIDDGFDFKSEEHLNSLKMILIKACDVSNECRMTNVADPWVDCLLEEYFHQSDIEKKESLPIAPFMDRDRVTKATAQIGFIRFVLLPLFESINRLFPEMEELALVNLRNSLVYHEKLKEAMDSQEADANKQT